MYIKRLYISNWFGEIYKVHNFIKNPVLEKIWRNEPNGQFDIVRDNCIFGTTPLGNQNKPNQFFRIPLGANYDIKLEKMTVNFIKYPDIYQHGEKWGFYHSQSSQCVNNKAEIIVSFPLDPNVYVYNKNGNMVKVVNAPCSYFLGKITPFEHPGEEEKYSYNEDKYEQIIYDKYRDIYYRFATKGVAGKIPVSSEMLYKGLFKPLYIIILDKNLSKIGEVELPENSYYFLNSFVSTDGLYISNSHPNNSNKSENQLTFSCYQLVDNLP